MSEYIIDDADFDPPTKGDAEYERWENEQREDEQNQKNKAALDQRKNGEKGGERRGLSSILNTRAEEHTFTQKKVPTLHGIGLAPISGYAGQSAVRGGMREDGSQPAEKNQQEEQKEEIGSLREWWKQYCRRNRFVRVPKVFLGFLPPHLAYFLALLVEHAVYKVKPSQLQKNKSCFWITSNQMQEWFGDPPSRKTLYNWLRDLERRKWIKVGERKSHLRGRRTWIKINTQKFALEKCEG